MADVTITDVVSGTLTGAGSFDKLMEAMTLHLKAQYDEGRITGTDYATVYLGGLQSVMAQAVQFTLGVNRANEEATLLAQKLVTEEAQTVGAVGAVAGVVGAQMSLYDAQKEGFYRDAEQKLIKILMDSWAVAKSVDTTGEVQLPANCNQLSLVNLIETARIGVAAATPVAPVTPTGFTATAGANLVTLDWGDVAGTDSYTVFWNTTGGVTTASSQLYPGDTSGITHTSLTTGTKYYYRVLASNGGGSSQLSAEMSATPT